MKRFSYYGKTERFIEREKRERYRGGRRGLQPGELVQMDAIVYFLDGIRRYVLVAEDVASRFGFAYAYIHLSSKSGWREFKAVAPFEIRGCED